MADPAVVREIRRVARRKRASPKEIKAAFETGIVESGLQNLKGGDADSAGWRQERASLYSDPTNVTHAAERFFDEARGKNVQGISAGELAARVQRPAAQYRGRYANVADQAEALLREHGQAFAASLPGESNARVELGQKTTFDQAGYDQAQKRFLLAGLLSKHGTDSPLFKTGVLSTTAPDRASFSKTSLTSKIVGGATGSVSAAAAHGGSGRTPTARPGKVIGTPHAGTHTLGDWQSDNAVDIAVPEGTPMVALQDGEVVKVRKHPQNGGRFAGDQITIRAANGNEYFYAHGVASVRPGQKIKRGQKLGVTGSANGVAHLHFGQMKGDPRMHTR